MIKLAKDSFMQEATNIYEYLHACMAVEEKY